MTRLLFTLFCCALLGSGLFSQNTFLKTYDTGSDDYAYHLLMLPDSGFLLSGGTASPGMTTGSLVRLNAAGQILWEQNYSNSNSSTEILEMTPGNDGGFVALAATVSDPFHSYVAVIKIDDQGQLLWSRLLGNSQGSVSGVWGKIVAVDAGYILSGVQENQSYIVRIDNAGNLVWGKQYQFGQDGRLRAFAATGDTILAAGALGFDAYVGKINALTGDIYSGATYHFDNAKAGISRLEKVGTDQLLLSGGYVQNGLLKLLVMKVGAAGNFLWAKTLERDNKNSIANALPMPDGGILLVPYDGMIVAGAVLSKLTADGAVQWAYRYGTDNSNFYDAVATPDGGYAAVGLTRQTVNDDYDMLLVKTDGAGLTDLCCIDPVSDLIGEDLTATSGAQIVAAIDYPFQSDWTPGLLPLDLAPAELCATAPPSLEETITFCPGETVYLQNQSYTHAGDVTLALANPTGCDTLITYHLVQLPQPVQSQTLVLEHGFPLVIDGVSYYQPDTVTLTLPGANGDCDTLLTYFIVCADCVEDTCSQSEAFVKYYGDGDHSEFGHTLCHSSDGNLYLGGSRGVGQTLLMKVTPNGQLLWSRSFEALPSADCGLTELIEDADGMLVGCGNSNPISTNCFAFRYDPVADTMLWRRRLTDVEARTNGILELTPGGNFLLNRIIQPTVDMDASELLELNRLTGALVGGQNRRYALGSANAFNAMLAYNGALYTVGTSTTAPPATPIPTDKFRCSVSRFDLVTRQQVWSRLSHVAIDSTATLYGQDLVIDNGTLMVVYSGREGSANSNALFLQKTTLNGNVLWTKRYAIAGTSVASVDELAVLDDGYLFHGGGVFSQGQIRNFLIKTDKNGNVLWSKILVRSLGFGSIAQHEILPVGDCVYVVGEDPSDVGTTNHDDIFLMKIDGDGEAGDSCGFLQPLAITSSPVVNPVNAPVNLTVTPFGITASNSHPSLTGIDMPVNTYCLRCPDSNPCQGLPDLAISIDTLIYTKDGTIDGFDLSFTLCNVGDTAQFTDGIGITLYDGNPFTTPAPELTMIYTYQFTDSLNMPGYCYQFTISNTYPFGLPDSISLYLLVNTTPGAATPLDSFPLSGVLECSYENNLDSIKVYCQDCVPPDTCQGLADLTFRIDNLACTGGQVQAFFTLCNEGDTVALPPNVDVTFYDADPFLTAAHPLQFTAFGASTLLNGGDCHSGIIPDFIEDLFPNGVPDSFTVYAVVNDDGALTPPFAPGDLAVTGVTECDYTNNLFLVTFTFPAPPHLDLGPDISACGMDSVLVQATPGFAAYVWQDGATGASYLAAAPGLYWVEATDACGSKQRDSVLLTLQPQPTDSATFAFCPGDFVTINGQVYTQPGIVVDTLASTTGGCDTLAVYVLQFLPQPVKTQVIEFCPGASVDIGGTLYNQPGTVTDTLPASQGCDTLATYILQYYTFPQPSNLSIACPPSQTVTAQAGANFVVVNYDLPLANTDCVCGGANLSLSQGPVSGGNFPIGVNTVCYAAEDSCGTSQSCCFIVTVNQAPAPDTACDIKTIGCIKYELLGITANFHQDRKYRIRVTNTCAAKMIYTVFEVPAGETAMAPANNSVYTAPSGNLYDVRNPNYQPFHSIRFKSKTDSIANGESDVFEYQLPSQVAPSYIHVSSRLVPNTFYEAYLNTFNCPIENGAKPAGARGASVAQVSVYPNPTRGELFADLSAWQGQSVRLRVLDALSREVWAATTLAGPEACRIRLSERLADGLFTLECMTEAGEREAIRFVLEQ